ncbi:single-stranded-DNA-specific exonuclease RecJ [Alkalibacter saccharofermentans]|uniref:Single-stranded-DNA-specific exonuclease RecJ n=1 Tax=Alkalibacter saccharofermentans DSM 14828 TaxID=1120975 RepID=A0A1M4S494_9FIRM|nr:single-stranded-DNA-specific exonuclease RecJ [Alkalibacter saccharofermentans]SHE27033.1 single-stranded-DNA-specific exonuclease [Alkalibacter saccharofermentans DSM 14828]
MKKWILKNKKGNIDNMAADLHKSKAFCNLLINRGFDTVESASEFLYPNKNMQKPPLLMKDMEKACDLLQDKILKKKMIRIVGDYDVDGISSSYILVNGILEFGGIVDWDIPDRVNDGYGLNNRIVEGCISDGIDTIITCDNGINAFESVNLARENGISVIITDHHETIESGEVPQCEAVLNPKQKDCSYPFKSLCGAGVAYKLVEELGKRHGASQEDLEKYLQFVALATVCDIVDLQGENRFLVKKGLEILEKTSNPGLAALIEVNGLNEKKLSSYDLGFLLGPCLNAAGRLDTAKSAIKLFNSKNLDEGRKIASKLKLLNEDRKIKTEEGVLKAVDEINANLREDKVLVVYQPELHESIAGIVAGRVKEKFHLPTLVLADGEEGVKGSGRSIEAYNMFMEISKQRRLLEKFGGHPMAVGLAMKEENIQRLRESLNKEFPLGEEEILPEVKLDLFLPLRFANRGLVEEIELMQPFGKANPSPVFGDKALRFTKGRIVGSNKNVLLIELADDFLNSYKGVLFNYTNEFDIYVKDKFGESELEKFFNGGNSQIRLDIAYQANINIYNGNASLQFVIKDYK